MLEHRWRGRSFFFLGPPFTPSSLALRGTSIYVLTREYIYIYR